MTTGAADLSGDGRLAGVGHGELGARLSSEDRERAEIERNRGAEGDD